MATERQRQRPWDALPNAPLINIFCRTTIKDRAISLPLVCRSWAHASHHPSCWASMVPHSYFSTPDDAFIKDSYPYGETFVDFLSDRQRSPNSCNGVTRLRALIQRASGGAAVSSLYFFPFLATDGDSSNDDFLLSVIAQSCPNLKHLSFHGSYHASMEAILEVIQRCNKLELVDFSDSPYFEPSVLKTLSVCCPNLRGLRRNDGYVEPSFASEFQSLRLLNLSGTSLLDRDLLTIVTRCQNLEYLDIRGCQQLLCYMYVVKVASARIAQIVYD